MTHRTSITKNRRSKWKSSQAQTCSAVHSNHTQMESVLNSVTELKWKENHLSYV
jgi:hypothetical protein